MNRLLSAIIAKGKNLSLMFTFLPLYDSSLSLSFYWNLSLMILIHHRAKDSYNSEKCLHHEWFCFLHYVYWLDIPSKSLERYQHIYQGFIVYEYDKSLNTFSMILCFDLTLISLCGSCRLRNRVYTQKCWYVVL